MAGISLLYPPLTPSAHPPPLTPSAHPPAGNPDAYLSFLFQALSMYQNNTVFTLGQNGVSSNLYPAAQPICNNADLATISSGVKCSPPSMVPKGVNVKPALTTSLP